MWVLLFVLIILLFIFLVYYWSKKTSSLNEKPGMKLLDYSDKVKNYRDKDDSKIRPFNKHLIDENGKEKVWYRDSERIFRGLNCFLDNGDREAVEKIVKFVFSDNDFSKEFINKKIERIYNCKEDENRLSHYSNFDFRYFFKNDKYTIFPFHISEDKRSLQILYFCHQKAIKVVEMPTTKYSNGNQNFIAYFSNDCFDDMCFLTYIMNRYPATPGLRIHGFLSAFNGVDISNKEHNEDFVIEYFYRMVRSRGGDYFPRPDAMAETCARMLKMPGYPAPTEWMSALAELNAEMQEKGIIKTKYHNYNERQLFFLVKEKYNDAIYQYRDEWLGFQSLDIYVPSLKIAIEFQGGQHYKAVKFYGGKQTFEQTLERDERKRTLCEQNGVKLIEWKFDLQVNKKNLEKMINKATNI